jgi:cellulose synthase/poly-beta-1,6-N-acetylglucosamine synthase-like glycosyltransferase
MAGRAVNQDVMIEQPTIARLSVVIPVRNRAGSRVRNALASLHWQTAGRPARIILVSHGSRPEIDAELADLCRDGAAEFVALGTTSDPWCKPLALNHGIRRTPSDVPFVMTMDVDMILAPNLVRTVIDTLTRTPRALALCQSTDLSASVSLPEEPKALREDFEELRAHGTLRPQTGIGGIQATTREFFFGVRGYDEDLIWWGAEDLDIAMRALNAGYRHRWITAETALLHQWHPKRHSVLERDVDRDAAASSWGRNHELVHARAFQLVRNPSSWGGLP